MSNHLKPEIILDGKRDNLRISEDEDFDDGSPVAVFLYVPDMDESDHEHLSMNMKQAKILHQWLGEFLKKHESNKATNDLNPYDPPSHVCKHKNTGAHHDCQIPEPSSPFDPPEKT